MANGCFVLIAATVPALHYPSPLSPLFLIRTFGHQEAERAGRELQPLLRPLAELYGMTRVERDLAFFLAAGALPQHTHTLSLSLSLSYTHTNTKTHLRTYAHTHTHTHTHTGVHRLHRDDAQTGSNTPPHTCVHARTLVIKQPSSRWHHFAQIATQLLHTSLASPSHAAPLGVSCKT